MKTTKIQFNAKSFATTRNIMNAYFGATYDLAVELAKAKTATKSYAECIRTDREQLAKLALGEKEGIIRTEADIRLSLTTNTVTYNKLMKPYEAMKATCEKAVADGVALFNNKDSALYKAYCEYVLNPTDDTYDAYAKAMADRFVELGLTDATIDNVAHYMVNADRWRRGTSAVKSGKIIDALTPKAFSEAILRKFHDNNASAFNNAKFLAYVEKVKKDAKNK